MIYRSWGEGWLMISQPAHAWLAGELAALWGNRDFPSPSPRSAVELATRLHDIGWAAWDQAPRLGAEGQPVNFIGTTFEETLPIWRTAVTQIFTFDPYAALLVSMHAATVYRQRLVRGTDPAEERPRVKEELERLGKEQEKLRANLAAHPTYRQVADPEMAERAYRWLRLCDMLSLALCSDVLPAEGEIENVPWTSDDQFTTIRYRVLKPFVLRLDPTPFSQSSVQFTLQARSLDQKTYPDQSAFQAALAIATWTPQKIIISEA